MLVHGTYAYVQHFCNFLIFTAFKMTLFKNHTGLRTKTVHHLIYNLQLLFMVSTSPPITFSRFSITSCWYFISTCLSRR